jgi:hypothetical protein
VAVLAEVFHAGRVAAEQTYRNPVLAETIRSKAVDTVGIGDPEVIFNERKYELYPTEDNCSYDLSASSELIHGKEWPKVFHNTADPGGRLRSSSSLLYRREEDTDKNVCFRTLRQRMCTLSDYVQGRQDTNPDQYLQPCKYLFALRHNMQNLSHIAGR